MQGVGDIGEERAGVVRPLEISNSRKAGGREEVGFPRPWGQGNLVEAGNLKSATLPGAERNTDFSPLPTF